MPYKRPNIDKPKKAHPVYDEWKHMEMFSDHDAGWIYPHIVDILDEARVSLSQFNTMINQVKGMDVSELKESAAKEKKEKVVLAAKRALMGFLKRPIEKYRSECNAMSNKILRITQPDSPSDPTKAMLQEMRFKEIRDNLKQINPKDRQDAVAGNLSRIQAVISNPDPSDIIIGAEALVELRRSYAFAQDNSLRDEEADQKFIYQAVRAKAAQVSATASKQLLYAKIDDPLTEKEFYETFTPEGTDHEKHNIQKRIEAEDKRQMEKDRKKIQDEKDTGINLGTGERVSRINRGIQH